MKSKIAVFLFTAFISISAQAGPISGDTWYEFRTFTGGVTGACAGTCTKIVGSTYADNSPWTFSGAGIFEVLDAFTLIDQFQVFDFGASIGVTSGPAGGSCGSNLANCIAAGSGYGAFVMGAGAHSITITNLLKTSGAHLFRFTPRVAAVPEPGTLSLLGMGLLGLGFMRKRKAAA